MWLLITVILLAIGDIVAWFMVPHNIRVKQSVYLIITPFSGYYLFFNTKIHLMKKKRWYWENWWPRKDPATNKMIFQFVGPFPTIIFSDDLEGDDMVIAWGFWALRRSKIL